MKNLALSAAVLGLAVTAAPAFAGETVHQTKTVSTAGIDLATPEGQKLLDQRIERVARQVCGMSEHRTGTRLQSIRARECLTKARASAKQQVASLTSDAQRGS
ncbi:UrcA family protein [Erythrobacter sp. MTPC3]|uniref:UrcA family protein n=1 Tax=Erythrobacter sp. MTPC3 TaxID=3056564 RepID=UPI0036F3D4B4